jgi:hypothetical protein
MDMREAFEQWWNASKYCQVALGANKQIAWDGWKAACEWQKQKDGEICERMTEGFATTSVWDEAALSCARGILNQGKDNG